jgi:hypothetical protein
VRAGVLSSTRQIGCCRRKSWRKIKVTTNAPINSIHLCSRPPLGFLIANQLASRFFSARSSYPGSLMRTSEVGCPRGSIELSNGASGSEARSTTMISSKTNRAEGKNTLGLVSCTMAATWICVLVLWTTYPHWLISNNAGPSLRVIESLCEHGKALVPTNHSDIWNHALNESKAEKHRSKVVGWFRGAVRIPYRAFATCPPRPAC